MCGIAGQLKLDASGAIDRSLLPRMTKILRHRGPEGFGMFLGSDVGLGHARLKIIDLAGGDQPIHNEDKTVWIVYNGEIFNYRELKEELEKKGHSFYTSSDTEVLVHLYEDEGADMFARLNGQFAFAVWDSRARQLLLGRDRTGILPLYYTVVRGTLLFASEVKALFMCPDVARELDPAGLDHLFTFWSVLPPRTIFRHISQLPPAHYALVRAGKIECRRYWDVTRHEPSDTDKDEASCAEKLRYLLNDSIRLRLRADVPVAAYMSGGIDSSLVSSLVKRNFNPGLETFSVAFEDKHFDEAVYQKQMADYLGTRHHEAHSRYEDIGRIMPEVIWHAETPLIRTAPGPLFLLSKLVRDSGIKVVLTGEGADEILGGYDLFRELKIRLFWARNPASSWRPLLLRSLYQYVPNWPRRAPAFLQSYYRSTLLQTDKDHYSHIPRWNTTAYVKGFFSPRLKESLRGYEAVADFAGQLPKGFSAWSPLAKAQYIEMTTLLSGNLLAAQGDRMLMAHSVEGRFPFLDHRLIEFCLNLPDTLKLKGLREKYLLKKIAAGHIPDAVCRRVKQAYRAPDSQSFFAKRSRPAYLRRLLSRKNLERTGYFEPDAAADLFARSRVRDHAQVSVRYDIAVVGIITTLLCDDLFVRNFRPSFGRGPESFTVYKEGVENYEKLKL